MRILPGLTASPAAATVKKGTYPVSTRVLPTAGSVFTPLKTPTRTITNPILTGPFISTQERSAATKNVLTSVTQKPAIGPLVLPKPYVTPKPVVQKNLTPLVTPKSSVPFQGRPNVTPVEQVQMKVAVPAPTTTGPVFTNNKNYRAPKFGEVPAAKFNEWFMSPGPNVPKNSKGEPVVPLRNLPFGDENPHLDWERTTDAGGNKVYLVPWNDPVVKNDAINKMSYDVGGILTGIVMIIGVIVANALGTRKAVSELSQHEQTLAQETGLGTQLAEQAKQSLSENQTMVDINASAQVARESFRNANQQLGYINQNIGSAMKRFSDDEIRGLVARARWPMTGDEVNTMIANMRIAALPNIPAISTDAITSFVSSTLKDSGTKVGNMTQLLLAIRQALPQPPPALANILIPLLAAQHPTQTVADSVEKDATAFFQNLRSEVSTGSWERLAVPVGQPVTTRQTVAPAPVRTAIPAQATAPVFRILPYATEAPPISSPVVTISTRQLPISTLAAPTTQPAAQTVTRPAPSATTEPWQMTPDERQSKVAALQVQYKRELAVPLMSEGNISPMQVGQMSKDQLARFQQDGQTRLAVEAQLQDLEHPELAKVRFDQNVVAKNQEQITALQSRLGVLQQFGQRKNGMMRPSYQKEIDKVQAQLDTLMAPTAVVTPAPPQTSPSAAISNQETGATTPVEVTAPVVARAAITPVVQNETQPLDIEDKNIDDLIMETMDTPARLAGTKVQVEGSKTAGEKDNGNPDHDGYLATIVEVGKNGSPVSVTREGSDNTFAVSADRLTQLSRIVDTGRVLWDDVTSAPTEPAPSETLQANDEVPFKQGVVQKTSTAVTPVAAQQPERRTVAPQTRESIDQQIDRAYKEKDPQAIKRLLEQVRSEGRTDALTGLKNSVAWEVANKDGMVVASADLTGLHWMNNKLGHDAGDLILQLVAQAFRSEGVDAYRKGGDEFAVLFATQEEADTMMERVQQDLEQTPITSTVNGVATTWVGWRLDYGTGEDFQSADAALLATRAELEQQGLRSTRAGQPVGVTQVAAGGSKTDQLVALVHQHSQAEPAAEVKRTQDKLAPWVAEGRQPTPRELLNSVVGMGYTLSESSRQMFDTKELNRLPMLQKLFRKSGTKVIGLDDLASRLFSEYGIDRPTGDMQDDDWLAQQLVAGASAGAGNATTDLFGSPIRTRAVAPTEAADAELFGKGQKAAFTTAQKNAAERGRHLQGQNQRTEQVRQAPVDEGILAGEVAGLPFNALNGNLGTNANTTGTQSNLPTTAGYEMNVTPPSGTTARTIAAENIQKVVLAVKNYVTTLASHPNMKATDYHAQLQDRLKQLGVPAGLFTPTEILKMYQASKGPSQLWNLTNRVLMKLNAYNAAQMDLAGALNTIPSSVLTKGQKRTLQDATLDSADFMRSLDFIDRELTKAQVTADLREKFDDMLAAEKEKAAIRLAKMAHRVDAAKLQAEEKAAAKDAALKDKATRDKAVTQINRMLSSVAKNVQSGHTIKLDYVDTIRSIVSGLTKDNKLMADAARQMTTEQLQQLAGAIKTQVAVGRIAYMADRAQREQTINDAVVRVLPHITPMAGYPTKTLNHLTYSAVVSRYGRVRNAAATMGQGITPAETIHRMLGLREMYMDFLGGLTDARQITDSWRAERLDKAKELGIATDLQQRRIGIWLINQTPGGRNHMLEGNKLTEDDIDSIVLTPEEQEYATFMQDHFDKNFPALRDYFRDFYNIEVTPVDAYTSLFNSSEFESDYEKAMKNLTFQNAVSGQRKTPKVGMAIKRTGGDNPVELNIFHIGDTYDDTMGYAMEFGPRLLKWWGVATNEEVMSKLGDLGNIYIRKNLVNLTYRGGPGGRTAESAMDKAADWLRRNLSRGQILLRPTSAMLQALQISNVAGITGQNFVVKAGALLTSDEKYGQWVKENFPLLRDSVRNYFEILGLPDDKMTQITGAMFRWCHDAARTTGAIANYMYVCQQAGIPVDWEHPDKDLLLEAMVMVNQEFGSEDIVSLPAALETGYGFGDDKSLARLILQFQQDTLARFDVLKTRIPGFKHKDARRAIRALFWMLLIGTGLVAGARYGYRKILKTVLEAKQQESDTYLAEYLKDIFEAVPFGNSIQSIFSYGDVPVPALSTLVDAATQAKNLITYQGGYAKLRAGIRLATDIGSTLISAPGIGTIGQIAGYMVPSGSTSSGSTTTKAKKPSKPTFKKPTKP